MFYKLGDRLILSVNVAVCYFILDIEIHQQIKNCNLETIKLRERRDIPGIEGICLHVAKSYDLLIPSGLIPSTESGVISEHCHVWPSSQTNQLIS